jgi:streptogramin lyase
MSTSVPELRPTASSSAPTGPLDHRRRTQRHRPRRSGDGRGHRVFSLPAGSANGNLNAATFDLDGVLGFTGQNGIYGRLDPAVGDVEVFAAPGGRGPYGIATTPGGDVYYASLAGSYVGLACCLR